MRQIEDLVHKIGRAQGAPMSEAEIEQRAVAVFNDGFLKRYLEDVSLDAIKNPLHRTVTVLSVFETVRPLLVTRPRENQATCEVPRVRVAIATKSKSYSSVHDDRSNHYGPGDQGGMMQEPKRQKVSSDGNVYDTKHSTTAARFIQGEGQTRFKEHLAVPPGDNQKSCYRCDRKGHIIRDCKAKQCTKCKKLIGNDPHDSRLCFAAGFQQAASSHK